MGSDGGWQGGEEYWGLAQWEVMGSDGVGGVMQRGE